MRSRGGCATRLFHVWDGTSEGEWVGMARPCVAGMWHASVRQVCWGKRLIPQMFSGWGRCGQVGWNGRPGFLGQRL